MQVVDSWMEKQLRQMKRKKAEEQNTYSDYFQSSLIQESSRWHEASQPPDKINVKDYSTVELTSSDLYSARMNESQTGISTQPSKVGQVKVRNLPMYPPGNDSVVKIHDLKTEFEKLKVQRQKQ